MNPYKCEAFEYIRTGKLRFIGLDAYRTGDDWGDMWDIRRDELTTLAELARVHGAFTPYPCSLIHSGDKEVGEEEHFLPGYFFKPDIPVPEGYDFYDINSEVVGCGIYTADEFPGEMETVYVMARDKILSDGLLIPYPKGYCHAEIYTNGRFLPGAFRVGYMFPTFKAT